MLSLQCSGFRGVIGSGLQAIGSKGGGSFQLFRLQDQKKILNNYLKLCMLFGMT